LKGLFFITGLLAEKIRSYPDIIELLEKQEIGYHSSSHSVRPTLIEYADVENFEQAYQLTLKRETSHVDPITGNLGGRGGVLAVKDLFPAKRLGAFRAPGFCWSPPILQAMRDLGMKYDFSTNLSSSLISFKGITFYPLPMNEIITKATPSSFFSLSKIKINSFLAVLYTHPDYFVNSVHWDSVYYHGNPSVLKRVDPRSQIEIKSMFRKWELIIKYLSSLCEKNLVEVTPKFKNGVQVDLDINKIACEYQHSMKWLRRFEYKPRYILNHFYEFFLKR